MSIVTSFSKWVDINRLINPSSLLEIMLLEMILGDFEDLSSFR